MHIFTHWMAEESQQKLMNDQYLDEILVYITYNIK